MGCDFETTWKEMQRGDRAKKTWEIRRAIGGCQIGSLTIEELILLVDIFKVSKIEVPDKNDLNKLMAIEKKLLGNKG